MSPDSTVGKAADPSSWNKYAYVEGDPVGRIDPTGRSFCAIDFMEDGVIPMIDYPCSPGDITDLGTLGAIFVGIWTITSTGGNPCALSAFVGGMPCVPIDSSGVGEPQPPPPPQCSISMYERPAWSKLDPEVHTYLEVTITGMSGVPDQDNLLEGGPTRTPRFHNPIGNWGNLVGEIEPRDSGQRLGSTNPAGDSKLFTDTGGADLCDKILMIEGDIRNYNSNPAAYRPIPTGKFYNSNSFTYTLLYEMGLAGLGDSVVGSAPGWNRHVPGL